MTGDGEGVEVEKVGGTAFTIHTCSGPLNLFSRGCAYGEKGKGSPHSTAQRKVPELIAVLGSQSAGDVSHKPGGRLPLLSARLRLPPQPLRWLLPVSLLGEQRHDGCKQFA